jgi:hypothetical protein
MEEFADAIFAGASQAGQIWHHFAGWWKVRHHPDVLFIFFEDMKEDLRGSVAKVAAGDVPFRVATHCFWA